MELPQPNWKDLEDSLKAAGLQIVKDEAPLVEKELKQVTSIVLGFAKQYASSLPFPLSFASHGVDFLAGLLLKEEDKVDGVIGD